ncbi:hypothetical protein [Dapis sp. BLCC M229]|uniref:hypothetical protein n=1 Tax=Dapis sp. BLCC M229 TaxID=3400188 RepID=UPI003CF78D44
MVQNAPTPALTQGQLTDVLGYSLSEKEVENCLKTLEYLTPKVGQFWQADREESGIYIIIAGKVRDCL